jgi:hypothetical protein
MNEANRSAIVLIAAGLIVLMAIVIFLTWAAPTDSIETLGDLVQEMEQNNDTAGKLVVTLGSLAVIVFLLLVIILELAPEDEEKELRVKQAGSTTIVPAAALRQRVEEAIRGIPEVTSVKARVSTKENAIATNLTLGLIERANVTNVTQEASRLVVDIIQTELGLPVAGLPEVRVSFGGEKAEPIPAAVGSETSAASSVYRPPEGAKTVSQESPEESALAARLGGDQPSPYARPSGAEEPSPFAKPAGDQSPYSRPETSEGQAGFDRPDGQPTEPESPPPATDSRETSGKAAEPSPSPSHDPDVPDPGSESDRPAQP